MTAVVTASALRGSMFKRNVYRDEHTLSNSHAGKQSASTVRCAASIRIERSARSHCVPNYCEHGSKPLLLADGRLWHHRQQLGKRSECLRLSLSCVANAASHRTHASFASPLRLSGDTPESRRGGAVTFSLSRHASCEGAQEGRGSHAHGHCAPQCEPERSRYALLNMQCTQKVGFIFFPTLGHSVGAFHGSGSGCTGPTIVQARAWMVRGSGVSRRRRQTFTAELGADEWLPECRLTFDPGLYYCRFC